MTRALLALLLLTGCATPDPGWTEVTFIRIPGVGGHFCYVAKPERVTNWVQTYADMAHQCTTTGRVEIKPEMDT